MQAVTDQTNKHTPGPWRTDPAYPCDVQNQDGTLEIASTHDGTLHSGIKPEVEAQEANARLIAAAPESHEANKVSLMALCVLLAEHADAMHPNMRKDVEFAIDANRAAIAKAGGPLT